MKKYKMKINGEKYTTHIKEYKGHSIVVDVNGNDYLIELDMEKAKEISPIVRSQKSAPDVTLSNPKLQVSLNDGNVVAPIPGTVLSVKVREGDVVKEGDTVIILEAMKMESDISAPISGTVKRIHQKDGASVTEGMLLMEIGA
jgi:glutaconyl-CoA/methylmalonyl-CoA decarboxylase subunit gamma